MSKLWVKTHGWEQFYDTLQNESVCLDNEENINFNKNMPIMLGDIFICCDVAKKQAKAYNHSLKREYAFLFLHGLLHLFGYDHMNEEDEKEMFRLQDEILNNLDIRRNK